MMCRCDVNIESSPSRGGCKGWQARGQQVSLADASWRNTTLVMDMMHDRSKIRNTFTLVHKRHNRYVEFARGRPLHQHVPSHNMAYAKRRPPGLPLGTVEHQHATQVDALVALPVQRRVPREGELCLHQPSSVARVRVDQPQLRHVAHHRLLAAPIQDKQLANVRYLLRARCCVYTQARIKQHPHRSSSPEPVSVQGERELASSIPTRAVPSDQCHTLS